MAGLGAVGRAASSLGAKGCAAYLPLYTGAGQETFWKGEVFNTVREKLEKFLSGPKPKTGQNFKFDGQWIWNVLKIKVRNLTFDTMLAHHLLDEEGKLTCRHGLKVMAAYYLDPNAKQFEQELDAALNYYDPKYRRYTSVPTDILYPYACSDADYTLQLTELFTKEISDQGLESLLYDVVLPLQQTCMFAEIRGLELDAPKIVELDAFYRQKRSELTERIYSLAGFSWDLTSSAQMADVLYQKLGLPEQTKKDKITTDFDALERLKDKHPVIEHILEYRSVDRLDSTYVQGVKKRMSHQADGTGLLFPRFLLHGTKTGRLSSEDPNVQNLPRKENGGDLIKSMYVAAPGTKWIMSDYSQIELRVAAHLSKEPVWIEAMKAGFDAHSATAKKCWNLDCDVSQVKKLYNELRTKAKSVNFGIIYGQTEYGLAEELKMELEEAQAFISDYFAALPTLKSWIDAMILTASEYKMVTNFFGRRRRFPDWPEWIPPKGFKPGGAPKCWGKSDSPPILKMLQTDLKGNLHLLNETEFLQNTAKSIRSKAYNQCHTCPYIGSCIQAREHQKLTSKVAEYGRQAVNAVVQAGASDLTSSSFSAVIDNAAANGIPLALARGEFGITPVLTIHDELVFQVSDSIVDQAKALIRDTMINIYPDLLVPLEVDQAVVTRWSDKV
jgi:DNA polymerase I-like protein with 3'-5' exonuclease and polymerase domains